MSTFEKKAMEEAAYKAPDEPGWYAVCLKPHIENSDQFPMAPPRVVYYLGADSDFPDDIEFDPLDRGGGGIAGIEDVVWWGRKIEGMGTPESRRELAKNHREEVA